MALTDITSRQAVLQAIEEYDRIGQAAFLQKYGFGKSREFFLVGDERRYDSKAVVGAAYAYQFPDRAPLTAGDFSGGEATVKPLLESLGFAVEVARHSPVASPTEFETGRVYNRRKDIHANFGGQRQGGISTPANTSAIFLFTGTSGLRHGYSDGWNESGIFLYTGEGQAGDMQFTKGNRAIRDHAQDGKDLYLFESLGKGEGCRYLGVFSCADWEYRSGTDTNGKPRRIIVFELVPQHDEVIESPPPSNISFEELRRRALAAASTPEKSAGKESKRRYYERSAAVRDYVLARANATCEACRKPAPFSRADGTPYLEPHHTRRLSDGGPDHPRWVGGVCPNCHREIHHGEGGQVLNQRLEQYLGTVEGQSAV